MAPNYKIRALTFLTSVRDSIEDTLEQYASKILEAKDKAIEETGYQVESVRIVLSGASINDWSAETLRLAEIRDDYGVLVSIGSIDLEEAYTHLDDYIKIVEAGFFSSIIISDIDREKALKASQIIHRVAENDPSYATRLGINVYGSPVETPYFPLASIEEGREGVAVAITYPNYLSECYRRNGVNGLKSCIISAYETAMKAGKIASNVLDTAFLGVDLSVAPWMEETTLGLVELVAGVRMPEPGFLNGIYIVNKTLGEVGKGRNVTGYNEVQLPVAEDLKLKARVAEQETTARDLARFTCVCLAGLDLAVVPADIYGVAGLILDTGACSKTKNKPLGVRIVPVEDVEPGDKVWLDKFGETPVIRI